MAIKARYFTKICYNLDEYKEYIPTLTHNVIATQLISVIDKDDKIILTFKEVYTEI